MIHIYTGNGKGKTTAAFGLALRAAGWGKKVYIAQFLKGRGAASGENQAVRLSKLNIVVERFPYQVHPIFLKKTREFDYARSAHVVEEALGRIEDMLGKKRFDMIILDEIFNAVAMKLVTRQRVLALIGRAGAVELILTGRPVTPVFTRAADYVSYIKKIKHPFDTAVAARKGIEF